MVPALPAGQHGFARRNCHFRDIAPGKPPGILASAACSALLIRSRLAGAERRCCGALSGAAALVVCWF